MKKRFLIIFAAMMVAMSFVTAEDTEPNEPECETCFVYGVAQQFIGSCIDFFQADPKLPAHRINKVGAKGRRGFYYGEAICNGYYKLTELHVVSGGAYVYNIIGLTGGSGFDFIAPSRTGVYFLSEKTVEGDLGRNDDDIAVLEKRIDALDKIIEQYKNTKWEQPLKEELAKVLSLYESK